ncbi:hyaluronidase PH-20-like [Choloepus didactylus]|uniref:hyaluronidase PH-20-like n=1 Tax=Choloepus didactylus TaxID=27675 RepID=UPI00189E554F|nr:hyaluronidase PH-20-like [Choloepus didactylus]
MGVLKLEHIFFVSFLGFNRAPQAVFTFLLIPCCLALNFRAPPLVPNVPFILAWNAPTELCDKKFNVLLDLSLFPLIGSPRKDADRHDIALFYADRLGYYPHINEVTGAIENGGIPQKGSLEGHLHKAANDIAQNVPTGNMGLAVIDWENWRPTWARNWKPKDIYKNMSIDLVMQKNPQLSYAEASKIAKEEFENTGKRFMLDTLKLGRSLRPNYLWGYYLFPDCYNHNYNKPDYTGNCFDLEKKRNDDLDWLWRESTALFPSIYLNRHLHTSPLAVLFARNRVQEAIRVSEAPNPQSPVPVFVYTRPVLTDISSSYLTKDDLVSTIGESVALGASGTIIWGSLNLTSSKQSCTILDNYMKTTLNPYLINVTLAAKMCSQVLCREQGVCVRKDWNSNDYLHLNPMNFAIQIGKDGKFTVQGKPTLADLQQFSEKFHCSCYTGSNFTNRDDIKNIDAVHVCVAKEVCIEAPVDSATRGHAKPSCDVSWTTPQVTKFPCAPRTNFNVFLEGTCKAIGTSNKAQEGCQPATRLKPQQSPKGEAQNVTHEEVCYIPEEPHFQFIQTEIRAFLEPSDYVILHLKPSNLSHLIQSESQSLYKALQDPSFCLSVSFYLVTSLFEGPQTWQAGPFFITFAPNFLYLLQTSSRLTLHLLQTSEAFPGHPIQK